MIHHIGFFPYSDAMAQYDVYNLLEASEIVSQEDNQDSLAEFAHLQTVKEKAIALSALAGTCCPQNAAKSWTICRTSRPRGKSLLWLHGRLADSTITALMPQLVDLAWQHNLLPWDWNKCMPSHRVWQAPQHCGIQFQRFRERCRSLLAALLAQLAFCRHIRRVENNIAERTAGYVIVLQRRLSPSPPELAEQVRHVRNILFAALAGDETLCCRYRAFWIESASYAISFTIEAYNKHPTLSAHMDGGEEECPERCQNGGIAVIEPLGRMSTSLAFRQLRELAGWQEYEHTPVWRRMGLRNMRCRYPNPADRLVASIKIEKRLRRIDLDLIYDAPNHVHGSVLVLQAIHSLAPSVAALAQADCLYISEESFAFIFPCIFPHAGDDFEYYSFLNVVGYGTWKKIVKSLRRIAQITLHAPLSPEWKKHYKDCSAYILEKNAAYISDEEDERLYFLHRYRLYDFYKFIIEWLEAHNLEETQDAAINIRGL